MKEKIQDIPRDTNYDIILSNLKMKQSIVSCVQKLTLEQDFEGAMNTVIRTILDYYNGNRAYIFKFDWENNISTNTYECCREGILPQKENLQQVPIADLQFWIEEFQTKKYVQIPALEEIKEERKSEYETLSAQNIRSLIAVPFFINKELRGFLGVDDPRCNQDNLEFLHTITYFICAEMGKRELHEKLLKLSYYDTLTGLYNRNRYYEYAKELKKRNVSSIGIIYADLNGLKGFNDTFGHDCGDTMICKLASIIEMSFPKGIKFRMSGDEFIIIFENESEINFYKKIATFEKNLSYKGDILASIGAVWDQGCIDIPTLIKKADILMYENKQTYYNKIYNDQVHIAWLEKGTAN